MNTKNKLIVKQPINELKIYEDLSNCQMQFLKCARNRHMNFNDLLKNHFTENTITIKK